MGRRGVQFDDASPAAAAPSPSTPGTGTSGTSGGSDTGTGGGPVMKKMSSKKSNKSQEFGQDSQSMRELAALAQRIRAKPNFIERETDEETMERLQRRYMAEDGMAAKSDGQAGEIEDAMSGALQYWREHQRVLREGTKEDIQEETRFAIDISHHDLHEMQAVDGENKIAKRWIKFDLFFGSVVVANGGVMGMATDGFLLTEGSDAMYYLEIAFTVVFTIEWLIRWRFNPRGLKGMFLDKWTNFDFWVITISYVDAFILEPMQIQSGVAVLAVLRVVRLFRLARLIRLLKLLKQLWMLMGCMFASINIIVWAIGMVVLISYIFGLLFYEVANCGTKVETHPDLQDICGDLFHLLLLQLRMATFDVAETVRWLIPRYVGEWILLLFYPFIAICAIGILNLVIGVMLTSAIGLTQQDERCINGTAFLTRHKALRDLRDKLTDRSIEEFGESAGRSPMVNRMKLLNWIAPPQISEDGEIEYEDLRPSFEKAQVSDEDIMMIWNELDNVVGNSRSCTIDEFIEACMWMKGSVHPLDVMKLMTNIRHQLTRTSEVVKQLQGVRRAFTDMKAELTPHVVDTTNSKEMEKLRAGSKEHGHKAVMGRSAADLVKQNQNAQEKALKEAEHFKRLVADKWMLFDSVWSSIIVVNMVTYGIEVSQTEPGQEAKSPLWTVVEYAFCVLYVSEVFVRAVFFYQMEVMRDLRTSYSLPNMIFSLSFTTAWESFKMLRIMIRDHVFAFELFVVLIGVVDVMLSLIVQSASSYLRFFQVFRLGRLLRLVRLMHLVKDIGTLAQAFANNMKMLMWSFVLLFVMCYMTALVLIAMLEGTDMDEDTRKAFRTVPQAMLTLMQVCTYSRWADIIAKASSDSTFNFFLLMLFISICAVGILNLVTGVMVEAAFSIVAAGHNERIAHASKMGRELLEKGIDKMQQAARKQYQAEYNASLNKINDIFEKAKNMKVEGEEDAAPQDPAETPVIIKYAIWLSRSDILVDLSLWLAKDIIVDPRKASLIFEGGVSYPTKVTPTPGLDLTVNQFDGQLLFQNVAPVKSVELRPAPLMGKLVIFPDSVDGSFEREEPIIDMNGGVIPESMNIRELNLLLDDPITISKLRAIHIRPDHLLMSFHKMSAVGIGRVDVKGFVDGAMRFVQPLQGMDIASSKSNMRLSMFEVNDLADVSEKSRKCATAVLETLQGIKVNTKDASPDEEKKSAANDLSITEEKYIILTHQKIQLKKKIANLESHVKIREQLLEKKHKMAKVVKPSKADDDDSHSVASAGEGWD
eukprot:TRINITY_DN12726_c3_g2_i1.p1 TRINITY_DN12726_c3_g2~~TRINITY_DN12726_c3_g2_i1.p1  ORF type:complete len:1270 (-),score=364.95 TRINITY_DN12726_c3_g2_i1:245-4054(-)